MAQLAQQGNGEAFAELVRRHRRVVRVLIRAILGSFDDAEDVTQEVFVRAYRAIRSYRPHHAFVTWLRRIAVNAAVSRLRERERGRRRDEQISVDPGVAPAASEEAAAAELAAQVRHAVGLLPLRQRLAVTLFYLDDMDLAETAAALGCSAGAVKSQLHRARETLACRLRYRLGEEEPSELSPGS